MSFTQNKDFLRPEEEVPKEEIPWPKNVQKQMLNYVLQKAQKNHPEDVLAKIDEFCAKSPMMHIGPEKAEIVNSVFKKRQPTNVLELGCYCGYSSLLFAHLTKEPAIVHSLDVSKQFIEIAQTVHKFAGMQNKISINLGNALESEEYLKNNGPFDMVLIDHVKALYKKDYELLLDFGVLKKDHCIIADNIIYPGAPEYLQFMKGNKNYNHVLYYSRNAQTPQMDAMLVSESIN